MRHFALLLVALLVACAGPGVAIPTTPDLTEQPSQQELERCGGVARDVVRMCALGYVRSGGDTDKDSVEYKYASAACTAAANWAGNACLDGTVKVKFDRESPTLCADIADVFKQAVEHGCLEAASAQDKSSAYAGRCLTAWAPKAASLVQSYCDIALNKTEM